MSRLLLWLLLVTAAAAGSQEADGLRSRALARASADLPRASVEVWAGRWEAIEALPADLKAGYGQALRAYQGGDLVLALHHLQALLDAHPDFPAALHQLGVVCFRLRRHDDARVAMERFLEHAPEHVGRTRVLAHALYGLGQHGRAREHYASVLSAKPGDLEARFGDALAAWRLGAEDEALAGFEAVLEGRPEHADAAYWRARVLVETERGEAEGWLAAVERAGALAPFDPRPAYLLSQVLLDLGRDEDAAEARARFERLDGVVRQLRVLDERLLLAPGDVDLLRERVRLLGALGDLAGLRRARLLLERALGESGDRR